MEDYQAEQRSSSLIIFWGITVICNKKKEYMNCEMRFLAGKFVNPKKVKYMIKINGGAV